MKFLFDLLPVILFFVVYKIFGGNEQLAQSLAASWPGGGITPVQAPILAATLIAIVSTALLIGWTWWRHRRVDKIMWFNLAIIVTLGGATLLFHNPTFIKWKPTALYWAFGIALAGSLLFRRNLVRTMLEKQITLPEPVWARLNLIWAAFFLFMGALNLYVAYNFSEAAWVNFKLFGGMGLMVVFTIAQGIYLARHLKEDAT